MVGWAGGRVALLAGLAEFVAGLTPFLKRKAQHSSWLASNPMSPVLLPYPMSPVLLPLPQPAVAERGSVCRRRWQRKLQRQQQRQLQQQPDAAAAAAGCSVVGQRGLGACLQRRQRARPDAALLLKDPPASGERRLLVWPPLSTYRPFFSHSLPFCYLSPPPLANPIIARASNLGPGSQHTPPRCAPPMLRLAAGRAPSLTGACPCMHAPLLRPPFVV